MEHKRRSVSSVLDDELFDIKNNCIRKKEQYQNINTIISLLNNFIVEYIIFPIEFSMAL